MRLAMSFALGLALAVPGTAGASEQDFAPQPPTTQESAPAFATLRGTIPQAERAWPSATTPPMSFRLGRRAGSPACGLPCAEFIMAEGDIRPDTADALMALWARIKRPLPVYLNSPGGSLEGGLSLGYALRKTEMPVLVGQRLALPCTPTTGCTPADEQAGITVFSEARLAAPCNSACVYAFAGGVTRGLLPGSTLGIHQFFIASSDDRTRKPKSSYTKEDFSHLQRTVSNVAAYLGTMGVNVDVLAMAAEVDAGAIRRLTARQAADLNLTTSEAPPVVATRMSAPPRAQVALAPAPPAPSSPPAAERKQEQWPVVTRDGKPFLVLSAATTSRRFGPISNEITIGCATNGQRYTAAFREIIPSRPESIQDAEVIVGSIGKSEKLVPGQGISRETAQAAGQAGVLELEVVSTATAGYPMRVDIPGQGLKQGLDLLETACSGRN